MYRMALHPDTHFAMWASPSFHAADVAALAVAASAADCTAVETAAVAAAAAGFVDLMMMISEHFVPFDYS